MGMLTEAVRKHHLSLAKTLSAHARAVGGRAPQAERDSFVAFLTGELLPHARGEERHLYPAMDELVQRHGRATATMTVDHEFIGNYIARIEAVSQQLQGAAEGERPRLLQQLRDLALERCHFGIAIEGRQAADHRDRKIMNVRDCDWRDCADQNVAHHAADDRHHERQKENAEQVEPLLYAQQSAAQGECERSHPVEHICHVLQEGAMHGRD
jgi:Hemerythrin HHE cation binding domain